MCLVSKWTITELQQRLRCFATVVRCSILCALSLSLSLFWNGLASCMPVYCTFCIAVQVQVRAQVVDYIHGSDRKILVVPGSRELERLDIGCIALHSIDRYHWQGRHRRRWYPPKSCAVWASTRHERKITAKATVLGSVSVSVPFKPQPEKVQGGGWWRRRRQRWNP